MMTSAQRSPVSEQISRTVEAEKNLLASCMRDPGALALAAQTVDPDMFYLPRHRVIYEAMLDLMRVGRPVDSVTIADHLGVRLKTVGGFAALAEIASAVPTAAFATEYAKIVRRDAGIRALRIAGQQIARMAEEAMEKGSDEDLYAKAQEQLLQVTTRQVKRQSIFTLADLIPERWEAYEADVAERSKVKTGFAKLDAALGGLGKGDVIVIAARPGMGKTALALNIARHAAGDGHVVLFFSLEMSREQVVDRLVAAEANIDLWRLRNKRLEDEDWERNARALQTLPVKHFLVDDTPGITTGEMVAKGMAVKVERGLDLVVVDYLGLVGDKAGAGRSRNDEVSQAMRNIKAMAKTLDVPVLLLSQLSREVERDSDKRPQLYHLRDSGEIEQTADVVLFIYRPRYYDRDTTDGNLAEVIIAKQRNGPTGTVKLAFLEEYTKFVPLEVRHDESRWASISRRDRGYQPED